MKAESRALSGVVKRSRETLLKWIPAPDDWITVNCDGSVIHPHGQATAGGIIRDSSGRRLAVFAANLGTCTITRAELRAAAIGLELAWEMQVRKVHLQTDSSTSVLAITNPQQEDSRHKHILQHIRQLMQRNWTVTRPRLRIFLSSPLSTPHPISLHRSPFTVAGETPPEFAVLLPPSVRIRSGPTMVSPENTNWLMEYGLIDDVSIPDPNFSVPVNGFSWPAHTLNAPSNAGFLELGTILEPGRPPKTDKAAILVDAVRMVNQLRGEAQKLKDSNSNLQEKIKELKVEKNELRDEKQRLKVEKEKLEQQLKTMNAQPSYMPAPPAIPAAYAGQTPGNKLVPFMGYPGVAMWQFMPPAAVDTSQDHVLRPPVA
ncbi:Transcription factor ILR3 [Linum perenne]